MGNRAIAHKQKMDGIACARSLDAALKGHLDCPLVDSVGGAAMGMASLPVDRIVLLHLSDIHFHRGSGSPYDLDEDLRNELERDAESMRGRFGHVDAILVTGDIAFSGKRQEYDAAQGWLGGLAGKLGCRGENVWTVPGNHDVDRTLVGESPLLMTVHETVRSAELPQLDGILGKYLSDTEAAELLYRPIAEYNHFARFFGCHVTPREPTWKHTLAGPGGLSIQMCGLNSALVSDATDDYDTGKLVLGSYQAQLQRRDGVVFLTLCHHPPDWLRDQSAIESFLNSRAHIQLFGHGHVNYLRAEVLERDSSLRVGAGAVHPDRRETGWQPRYNLISVVHSDREPAGVAVDVFPRIWDLSATRFVGDTDEAGADSFQFVLRLDSSQPGLSEEDQHQAGASVACDSRDGDDSGDIEAADLTRTGTVNPYRRLAYRFLTLPYRARIAISNELDLYADDDADVAESELFRRFFRRARERGKLRELWDKVEGRHEDGAGEPNPFVTEASEEVR